MAVLAELVFNHWVTEKDALAALALAVPLNGRPWKRPLRPDVVRRHRAQEAQERGGHPFVRVHAEPVVVDGQHVPRERAEPLLDLPCEVIDVRVVLGVRTRLNNIEY